MTATDSPTPACTHPNSTSAPSADVIIHSCTTCPHWWMTAA